MKNVRSLIYFLFCLSFYIAIFILECLILYISFQLVFDHQRVPFYLYVGLLLLVNPILTWIVSVLVIKPPAEK